MGDGAAARDGQTGGRDDPDNGQRRKAQPNSAHRQQPQRPRAAATEDIGRTAGWQAGGGQATKSRCWKADEATQTTAQRPKAAATDDVDNTARWRAGNEVAAKQ